MKDYFGKVNRSDYQKRLVHLLNWASPRLRGSVRLDFKPCFGAVAGYADGKIFVSSGPFGVALKLSQDELSKLFNEPGVKQLKYFARGHVKKDYAILPPRILSDRSYLRELINSSIRHVSSSSVSSGLSRRH